MTLQALGRGYVAECFEPRSVHVPPVPAESCELEALELGPVDAQWRSAAQAGPRPSVYVAFKGL